MQIETSVGAFQHEGNGISMTVKATAGALNYGDIVIIDATNDDVTDGIPAVKTLAGADSALVCGVVCSPGGIEKGGVGKIGVMGLFRVNTATDSTNFAAGAALTTSATAGKAADGAETLLNLLGKVWYSPNVAAKSYVTAWINVL